GELDVAHALAAHLGERHLDAALLAGDAAELHALVLAAQALVVLDRSEDAGAEQPVPFRLESAVVDGLRLLDLAVAPGADALGAGDRDADLVEGRSALGLAQYVDQIGHLWGPTVSLDLIREGKKRRGRPRSVGRRVRHSCGGLVKFDVEAERAQLLDQDVEGCGNARLEGV